MSKKRKTKAQVEDVNPKPAEVEEVEEVEEEAEEVEETTKTGAKKGEFDHITRPHNHPPEMVKAYNALTGTVPDDDWTNAQLRKEINKLVKAACVEARPPSGYSLAMKLTAENPNITRKELKEAVKEEIPEATDGSIESAHSQTRMVIRALIEVEALSEDILD